MRIGLYMIMVTQFFKKPNPTKKQIQYIYQERFAHENIRKLNPPGIFTFTLIKAEIQYSKKSPTGPTERTPKPEYLIALATDLGVRWDSVPFNF